MVWLNFSKHRGNRAFPMPVKILPEAMQMRSLEIHAAARAIRAANERASVLLPICQRLPEALKPFRMPILARSHGDPLAKGTVEERRIAESALLGDGVNGLLRRMQQNARLLDPAALDKSNRIDPGDPAEEFTELHLTEEDGPRHIRHAEVSVAKSCLNLFEDGQKAWQLAQSGSRNSRTALSSFLAQNME